MQPLTVTPFSLSQLTHCVLSHKTLNWGVGVCVGRLEVNIRYYCSCLLLLRQSVSLFVIALVDSAIPTRQLAPGALVSVIPSSGITGKSLFAISARFM